MTLLKHNIFTCDVLSINSTDFTMNIKHTKILSRIFHWAELCSQQFIWD